MIKWLQVNFSSFSSIYSFLYSDLNFLWIPDECVVHSRGTFFRGGSGKNSRKWMDEYDDGYVNDEEDVNMKGINNRADGDELPMIYIITPTYSRGAQKADLTRLSHTLLLVPKIHWILVEDSPFKTELVTNFISSLNQYIIPKRRGKLILGGDTTIKSKSSSTQFRSNAYPLFDLKITHLNIETPADLKIKAREPNWIRPRGVNQRNLGLKWLRNHLLMINKNNKELHNSNNLKVEGGRRRSNEVGEVERVDNNFRGKGVVYFADDDNTYDLRLFEEMRNTKKVSIWPVGLVGGLKIEKPLVQDGKVVGFNSVWSPNRPYPIDMAGFAINLDLLLAHPSASFSYDVPRGHQESHIITLLISGWSDLEPKATNCTQVLVWHTRTVKPSFHREVKLDVASDLNMEF